MLTQRYYSMMLELNSRYTFTGPASKNKTDLEVQTMLREGAFISVIDRRTGTCFTRLNLFGSDFAVCGNLSISHIIFLLLNINGDMVK